jgi:hypothetical protein
MIETRGMLFMGTLHVFQGMIYGRIRTKERQSKLMGSEQEESRGNITLWK